MIRPGLLLDVTDLDGLDAVVLDTRLTTTGPPGPEQYAAGHLPGAVYVDVDDDLAGPPGAGGRHPLPEPERFVAAMQRAGVRRGSTVVVYDAGPATAAARLWWLLRDYGHDDVLVLDGGLAAWTGRRPTGVHRDHRTVSPGDWTGMPGPPPHRRRRRGGRAAHARRPGRRARRRTVPRRDGAVRPGRRSRARRGERPAHRASPTTSAASCRTPALRARFDGAPRRRRDPPGRAGGGVLRLRRHRLPDDPRAPARRASTPRSTPAAGAAGSPTRRARWRPVPDPDHPRRAVCQRSRAAAARPISLVRSATNRDSGLRWSACTGHGARRRGRC